MHLRLASPISCAAAASSGAGSTYPGGNCCASIRVPTISVTAAAVEMCLTIDPPVDGTSSHQTARDSSPARQSSLYGSMGTARVYNRRHGSGLMTRIAALAAAFLAIPLDAAAQRAHAPTDATVFIRLIGTVHAEIDEVVPQTLQRRVV